MLDRKALGVIIAVAIAIGLLSLSFRTPSGALPPVLTPSVQLNDSTAARVAREQRTRADSLEGLLTAAKALNGKLVAAARFTVPARDTVIVHDSVPTQVLADSTRTATVHDSTFAGVVTVNITAPPCCAALKAKLTVERPAFTPSVGFVELANRQYAAVVVWQGQQVSISSPYFAPPTVPEKHVIRWVEATYNLASAPEVAGGVSLAWRGLSIGPSVRYSLADGTLPRLGITLRRTW
jgi:hypothetical protein